MPAGIGVRRLLLAIHACWCKGAGTGVWRSRWHAAVGDCVPWHACMQAAVRGWLARIHWQRDRQAVVATHKSAARAAAQREARKKAAIEELHRKAFTRKQKVWDACACACREQQWSAWERGTSLHAACT